jgi:hypothetical protein
MGLFERFLHMGPREDNLVGLEKHLLGKFPRELGLDAMSAH